MRICIPTEDNNGLDSRLAAHFGATPFFTLVDLDTGAIETRPNPACHSHPGSCHHVDLLRSERVDAVVSSGLGRKAYQALQQAGIPVLLPAGPKVADVVAALRRGENTPMDLDKTCRGHDHGHDHGHGHGHRHQHCHQHGHHDHHSPERSS